MNNIYIYVFDERNEEEGIYYRQRTPIERIKNLLRCDLLKESITSAIKLGEFKSEEIFFFLSNRKYVNRE